jgi:hypothetical protein
MIQYRQRLPSGRSCLRLRVAGEPCGSRGVPSMAFPTITTIIGNSPAIAEIDSRMGHRLGGRSDVMAALRH